MYAFVLQGEAPVIEFVARPHAAGGARYRPSLLLNSRLDSGDRSNPSGAQQGRANLTIFRLPELPGLDCRALDDAQLRDRRRRLHEPRLTAGQRGVPRPGAQGPRRDRTGRRETTMSCHCCGVCVAGRG